MYDEDGTKYYDVIMHGTEKYVEFFGQIIDGYTLGEIISKRDDYNAGIPIRLLSCSTGKPETTANCVAQILSNVLGPIVIAPSEDIYVCSSKCC